MNTINERIRKVRIENNLNQQELAALIGITQSGVSHMEQNGRNVSDVTIKAICAKFSISEDWLRFGEGDMYSQPPKFNLGDYANQHGMSELELKILKIYFEFEPEKRQAALSYFLDRLKEDETSAPSHPATAQEMEELFPPISEPVAKSTQSH